MGAISEKGGTGRIEGRRLSLRWAEGDFRIASISLVIVLVAANRTVISMISFLRAVHGEELTGTARWSGPCRPAPQ